MQIQGHVNRFVDKKIVIDAPPPVGVIIYRWVTVIDVDPDQGVPFEHIEARHRAMPTDARWTDLNAPICIEVDQGLLHLDSQDGVVSSDVAALHFCP